MSDTAPDRNQPPAQPPQQKVEETGVGKSIFSALASDANQVMVAAIGGATGAAVVGGAKKLGGIVHRNDPDSSQPRGKHAAPPKAD